MNESNTQHRPVISVVIRPRTSDDGERLQRALSELAQEDLTIRIAPGSSGGETIVGGMGELHLEIVCDRVVREYRIPLDVGEFARRLRPRASIFAHFPVAACTVT